MKLLYRKGDKIEAIIKDLRYADEVVLLVMEPGDGTHYEFMILEMNGYIFWSRANSSGNGWSMALQQEEYHIDYIHEKMGDHVNRCTAQLVAEIHNRAFGGSKDAYGYFDFTLGRAIV